METGIQHIIEKAGSQSELARGVNVAPQAVQKWVKNGFVPARRVKAVAKLLGMSIQQVRPDLFSQTDHGEAA